MLFACHPKILHKHHQFLLGVKMDPRETENNAYAKLWGDKERAIWYVMVFSGVVNWRRISFSLPLSKTFNPKGEFYNQIQQTFVDFNQLFYTELIFKLMNSQNFSVNSHLLKFVSLCNDLRTNLLTVVIIALHYYHQL